MVRKIREHGGEKTAERLRDAGLRPTRQRLELAGLLFGDGDRHLTAENLHDEAERAGIKVSLATVYNTLHQFTEAGLLRQVMVDASRSYFDTNIGNHQHFYCEDENRLIDIPGETIAVAGIPVPPKGTQIERVDVVIRVRRQ
ncbi:MAG TPA: Fur family transcriptional regulator [Rhizomicrobium sp.]|nr:Fur family transcriptional regulator [Rhizomicrobium sp.]